MFQKNQDEETQQYANTTSPEDLETVVGPSMQVEGDFVSEGSIIVKGTVSGTVKTSKLLRAEEGSKIIANIKAADAVICGQVKGSVRVNQTIEISATAQILGDISCKSLTVQPGALISGKITMSGIEMQSASKPAKRRVAGSVKTKKDRSVGTRTQNEVDEES
ncbi:MAG: hypothetical protein CL685_00375 [Candidatus Magasanikbacteria bacterium]|nr:hypothetical protein [Candidatus Magasanikbacteria bacterium]